MVFNVNPDTKEPLTEEGLRLKAATVIQAAVRNWLEQRKQLPEIIESGLIEDDEPPSY